MEVNLGATTMAPRFFGRQFATAILLPFAASSLLWSQTSQGGLAGTVTDPTGAIIAGVAVTARNTETGAVYQATTTSAGAYRLPEVSLGTYQITFAETGFQTQVRSNVTVQISTTSTVNAQLTTGEVSQSVTVSAGAPEVQTETSEVGTVVTPQQVSELPLSLGGVGAFRSPEAFVFLTPGTSGPGTAGSSNGVYVDKIAGSQNFGNEVLLDGISAVRPDNGSTFDEIAPSVEAIQEFKVIESTPQAQYGRTTGGLESFATKSGANTFHGGGFDILRNTRFDANTWFNDGNRTLCAPGDTTCQATFAVPKDIKNDFGAVLSGPVSIPHLYNGHDKTFFFFAWEQLRWPRSGTTTSTLPTAAERTGDFSAALTNTQIGTDPCTGAPVYAGEIFDSTHTQTVNGITCRLPFAGNVIPASQMTAVAQNVLKYLPLPNLSGNVNNYDLRTDFPTTNTTYTIRIDQSVGAKDKIFADYNTRENTLLTGGTPVLPNPIDSATWNQDFTAHLARFGWDHVFSLAVLNHFGAGYNRENSKNNAPGVGASPDWGPSLGLPGVSGLVFPQFNVGESIPAIGEQKGDDDIGNTAILNDTLSWVKGRHSFSFGGEGRFYQYNNLAYDNTTGSYNFSRGETAVANDPVLKSEGGNSFASFLLGEVDSANLLVYAHYPRYTNWYAAAFVQDDFKATSRLTLNLGFRWSVDTPRTEALNDTSNFDPSLANPAAGGRLGALEFGTNCNGCNPAWANTYYKDFAPRIGFAWSPYGGGNTAVRGGYGIIYGPELYSDFANSVNAGYAASESPSSQDSSFSPAFNLAGGFPHYTAPPNLDPTIRNGQSVDYIAPQYGKPPMLQTWDLQVQQQLAPDLIFSIAYVGNHGTRERTAAAAGAVNDIPFSNFALGSVLSAAVGSPQANAAGIAAPYPGFSGIVGNALRPYPQYLRVNADCCIENDGQSTYHSLQTVLQRQMRNGLSLLASYTWAKDLTDSDSMLPGTNGGGGVYQNPFDLHQEKSLSSQDIRNTFVVSYIYQLPFGTGKRFLNHGRLVDEALGGWEVGAVQRYESGQPLPFYCAGSIPGDDNCVRFNAAPGQSVFNATVANGTYNPYTQSYINHAYFVDPNQNRGNGAYQLGTLPRVTAFRMPHYDQEDFAVSKRFAVREGVKLLLRGEAFNAFNRHVFAEPYDLNPNDPNFGDINSTVDTPRQLQVTGRIEF